jgi:glucose-fructose oxidoreductase
MKTKKTEGRSLQNRNRKKVRYAVAGLGYIAQIAVLPAFGHATRNSELTALVSGDHTKLRTLSKKYDVKESWSYEQFEECLETGGIDALYVALPNSLHRDYVVRAAEAGVHVLCEKPLGLTEAECNDMIEAARANHVQLMTAYRLHFDEPNLRAVSLISSGKIGKPRLFHSVFSPADQEREYTIEGKSRGRNTV